MTVPLHQQSIHFGNANAGSFLPPTLRHLTTRYRCAFATATVNRLWRRLTELIHRAGRSRMSMARAYGLLNAMRHTGWVPALAWRKQQMDSKDFGRVLRPRHLRKDMTSPLGCRRANRG